MLYYLVDVSDQANPPVSSSLEHTTITRRTLYGITGPQKTKSKKNADKGTERATHKRVASRERGDEERNLA